MSLSSFRGLALAAAFLLLSTACRKSLAAPRAAAASGSSAAEEPAREPSPAAPASPDSAGYPFSRAERKAVEEFLGRHPDLRLAKDSDREEPSGSDGDVRKLYGVYHPYFVRGDLNDDGILDFVLAFVRRDSSRGTPWFSVVVFTGKQERGDSGFSAGSFIERDVSLSRGDLSVDRDAVLITPDLADEAVRRYRWDPMRRSYIFVRDDADDDDTPVPSRT
ncbi:MAG TPA: hypothetical protein VKH43_05110 [Thermoanaerobaculia bacterium]|nr:hypothetical protein [Thermoanaerobaculia bacterium]